MDDIFLPNQSPYPVPPIYTNGIEVSGTWSGNNLAGRKMILEVRVYDGESGKAVKASSPSIDNLPMIFEDAFGAYLTGSQKEEFTFYLPLGPFQGNSQKKI
jgi:hypothetical protein